MNINDNVLIIGGDKRQLYLYKIMEAKGHKVSSYDVCGIDNNLMPPKDFNKFNIFILPIPFSKNQIVINGKSNNLPISEFIENIPEKCVIYGGSLSQTFINLCHKKNCIVWDLMKSDAFSIKNSIATAEGAIASAIINSPLNLHSSNTLVLGYGKCGEALAKRLKNLNANVTIGARRQIAFAKISEAGLDAISIYDLEKSISKYEFIFNTIPSILLNKDILSFVNKNVTIIDIASKPGGVDHEFCRANNINSHLIGGIPGLYSPLSSAEIIYDFIM